MELQVKNRTIVGKKVKNLRKEGFIPAELFGRGVENRHLSIPEKQFLNLYKKAGGHTIIQVLTEAGEKIPAIISEVQYHPILRRPLSVLIHQIRLDEEIETKVPIEFKGTAPAEKGGFVVVKVLGELEIKALPDKIPHSFEVDLQNLKTAGESIHVGDLKIPADIKVMVPADTVVVSVKEKTKEEEPAPPPAAEAEAAPTAEAKAEETPAAETKEEKKESKETK